ncbi:MAG: CPBP family intramembrane metalloprotease [Chlorobi bacterium]|nr:CPBP family intramembrane metalloprotease [Chlorobiota bacterium]
MLKDILPDVVESDKEDAPSPGLTLDGSWERNGRNIVAAAVVGLLLIGATYFIVQSILVTIAALAAEVIKGQPDHTASAIDLIAEQLLSIKNVILAVVLVTQITFLMIPTIILVRRWHSTRVLDYIRWKSASALQVVLAVVITAVFVPVNMYIGSLVNRLFPVPEKIQALNNALFTAQTPLELGWIIMVVAVTPAICEEVLFRGYVQRTLERRIGWKSIIVVGLMFGLYHMNPLGLVNLSLIGFLLGYLFYRSGSLVPTIVSHFTNNLLAVLMLYLSATSSDTFGLFDEQVSLARVAVLVPTGIILLVIFHNLRNRAGDVPTASHA